MKRQALYHMYSVDDDKVDDDEMTDEESTRVVTTRHFSTSATQDKCKCGSSEHWYTSYRLYPLNKKSKHQLKMILCHIKFLVTVMLKKK